MAGRKVFTSGEILTAADVNSFLMDQSVMVFADSTARSSAIPAPTEGMVTYVEDANRVEVYDGAAFGPIGGILQVVQTVKANVFSTSSTSLVNITGLSASITPSSTSSKILIFFSGVAGNSTSSGVGFDIVRDSTAIAPGAGTDGNNSIHVYEGGSPIMPETVAAFSVNFLDSPATTSALTYKIQMRTLSGGSVAYLNRRGASATIGGQSSITLFEVAV